MPSKPESGESGGEGSLTVDLPPIDVWAWRKQIFSILMVLGVGAGTGTGTTWWHLGGGDVEAAREDAAKAQAALDAKTLEVVVLTERITARDQTISQLGGMVQEQRSAIIELQATIHATQDALSRILSRYKSGAGTPAGPE
jgi:hypothetical protein